MDVLGVALSLCLRIDSVPACAQRLAGELVEKIGLTRTITVRVVDTAPTRNARSGEWAWSRRDKSGRGCHADFLLPAAKDIMTIAHEVCHCRWDWEIMTVSGAVAVALTKQERERIEHRADACAESLVGVGELEEIGVE